MHSRKKEFTLIELLVVIGIIGILASMLMPALSKAREKANTTTCLNQMKNLSLGVMQYRNDNRDAFPYWLSTLYPDYIDSRKVYHCPSIPEKYKKNPDPHPWDNNDASMCYDRHGTPSIHEAPNVAGNQSSPGKTQVDRVDYLFQMSDGNASSIASSWFDYPSGDGEAVPMSLVKEYQLENGDKYNDHKPYDPTVFPIMSCFFHLKKAKGAGSINNDSTPLLNISYTGNFFMSRMHWEDGQWTP